MSHDQIRLDDLLARDVSVQWFEGVALVQALCRQLAPRSGADDMFPGVSQITFASDGTVTIGGVAATRAVPEAGHLLARMRSDDAPVRLRLLVTQATAEDATSGSLHEFSESLAYFERPNPEAILSALHARAAVAPPARRQDAEIAEPVAERTPRASSREPRARKRRRPVVRAAAAILRLAVTGLFVRAGLRNGRLASVVEGLKRAVATPPEATIDTRNDEGTEGSSRGADHGRRRRDPRATPIGRPCGVRGAITLPPASGLEPPIVTTPPVLEDVLPAGAPASSNRRPWRATTRSTRDPMRRSRRRGRSIRRCPPTFTGKAARGSHRPRSRGRRRRAGGARAVAHAAARCP